MLSQDAPGTTPRERLNLWYLTDAGQAELLGALATGDYRVEVPEDGALMTVAWLLAHGDDAEAALDVVAQLRPLMRRLRMTPAPDRLGRAAGHGGDCAHAWRQVVFFLSFCDRSTQDATVERLALGPAVAGLRHVVGGGRFDTDGMAGGARRFLGWSAGHHWALGYLRL